jgi:hypothetical protein
MEVLLQGLARRAERRGEVMSTFMEHIHRDTATQVLFDDDAARQRTVEEDSAPSDNQGRRRPSSDQPAPG